MERGEGDANVSGGEHDVVLDGDTADADPPARAGDDNQDRGDDRDGVSSEAESMQRRPRKFHVKRDDEKKQKQDVVISPWKRGQGDDVVLDGDTADADPPAGVGNDNQDRDGVSSEAESVQRRPRKFHVKRDDEKKQKQDVVISPWNRGQGDGEGLDEDEEDEDDDEHEARQSFELAAKGYTPKFNLDIQDDETTTSSSSPSPSSPSSSSSSSSSSSGSSSSSSSTSSGSSSSEQEMGEWNEEDETQNKQAKPRAGMSLRGMLTRQDHIRHIEEEDVEYFTPTDSDEEFGIVLRGGKNAGSLTPPMSPRSKTRYRCIKGELAARKSRTAELRAKHSAARELLEAAAEKLEDQVDRASIVEDDVEEAESGASIMADIRLRTSLFTKTNGLSQFPVCTCNGLPMTTLGPKDVVQYASYCQVHFPFASAKMGKFGTSHSEAHVEEATRRLRDIFLQEQERELRESKKKTKLDVFRGQFSSLSNPESHIRYGGDTDDSDWDLANVSRTIRQPGGAPLVVPNPYIERSKRRIKELREAHGYQLFETKTHYMIITNDASKTLYRVAKIERFSDEFEIDEDAFLYSQLQVQNLLKMASQSQQGCKLISSGTGIVGFIQLFSFESSAETGLDLDGVNGAMLGDTIRITEEIYRKHVRAMKRKELMFAFLEHTKTARGAPAYLDQFGHKQGYTLFSGADKVRPIGAYGSRAHARELPTNSGGKDGRESSSARIGAAELDLNLDGDGDADKDAGKPAWYARILESIDSSITAQEDAKQKELDKLKSRRENTESEDEREAKKKEEEEAAALAASCADWTKLILEGFIAPEIPTNNALPGRVLQVTSNKYIYRTKYLTVFKDLEPSEDEDSENDIAESATSEEGDDVASSDSEGELMPSKMSRSLGRSFVNDAVQNENEQPTISVLSSLKKPSQSSVIQIETQDAFMEREEAAPARATSTTDEDSANVESTLERASTVTNTLERANTVPIALERASTAPKPVNTAPQELKRSHTAGVGDVQKIAKQATFTAEKAALEAKRKPTKSVTIKENAVRISSMKYTEDLVKTELDDFSDDDDDDSTNTSESELSEVDEREFLEYTLIERILIFLGFLEDTQAKAKEVESDSDDEPGFFSRAYSMINKPTSTKHEKSVHVKKVEEKKAGTVLEPTPTRFRRNVSDNKENTKEDPSGYKPRMNAEEMQDAIDRRRLKLEARTARRKERARLREKREKARQKAQRRIARYRFDPEQVIVKLRFKSFGSHAPLLL